MRVLPVRTISGRIVLGFVVLLVTFGAVSLTAIWRMRELGRELSFIRTTYLDVLLRVAELRYRQGAIVDVLSDVDASLPPRTQILGSRTIRRRLLEECAQQVASLQAVPPRHARSIDRMRERIAHFLTEMEASVPLYDAVTVPGRDPAELRAQRQQLKMHELRLQKEIGIWFKELRNTVDATTTRLELAEQQARWATMGLGALAALIALLVTVWAVLTLRPLGRLRDGVRRVAAGDYRERLQVADRGDEVSVVAREFNAMAQAIEEREQELVRSERLAAVGKMAALIAHEIRNPLSSIGLNAELLEEELGARSGGSPEAASLLKAMQKELDRLTGITEEYLRFARLPGPRLEREQVNDIISELIRFQQEELSLQGVEVEARLDEALPPVAADEGQLRQALLNLLRNAADAMAGAGGRIGVTTRRAKDGMVEVTVSDTGPGIPPEALARIFEPFFSTKEGGTGLGLALTRQVVAEHGGRIDVESQPGRGTTFTMRLPADTEVAPV